MAAEDLAGDLADRVARRRRDEDVRDPPLALAHELVDRRERLDVLDQRVGEQGVDDLGGAGGEVRARRLGAGGCSLSGAIEFSPTTITRLAPSAERGLDRRVEAGAAVEVPGVVDLDRREQRRDRATTRGRGARRAIVGT